MKLPPKHEKTPVFITFLVLIREITPKTTPFGIKVTFGGGGTLIGGVVDTKFGGLPRCLMEEGVRGDSLLRAKPEKVTT